jgi:hypothetical protein
LSPPAPYAHSPFPPLRDPHAALLQSPNNSPCQKPININGRSTQRQSHAHHPMDRHSPVSTYATQIAAGIHYSPFHQQPSPSHPLSPLLPLTSPRHALSQFQAFGTLLLLPFIIRIANHR